MLHLLYLGRSTAILAVGKFISLGSYFKVGDIHGDIQRKIDIP